MKTRAEAVSETGMSVIATAAVLCGLVLSYVALCLLVLHRPEWLPDRSILQAALVGPPHWLVWGAEVRPAFWGSTCALVLVGTIGASFRSLMLPCAGACFLIWTGSGFFSVAMSV